MALQDWERSSRTPKIPRQSNNADQIESFLEEDGEDRWGFIIYRCTYENAADWAVFLTKLRDLVRKHLEYYNGADMMAKFDMTVIEDYDSLNGATTSTIREKFRQWSKDYDEWTPSQRYRYCIQIDDASLRSFVDASAEEEFGPLMTSIAQRHVGAESPSFVNLIWRRWEPYEILPGEEIPYDPIEGVTLEKVGWMRVAADFIVEMYCLLRDLDGWYSEYQRPPKIAAA